MNSLTSSSSRRGSPRAGAFSSLIACLVSCELLAQATFTSLGPIPSPYQTLAIKSVTDDGEVMAILIGTGSMNNAASWNKSAGFTVLPMLEPGGETRCEHVTPDGRFLAGLASRNGAFVPVLWIDKEGPMEVFRVPAEYAGAHAAGVSWDGSVVGGLIFHHDGRTQGYLVSETHGLELIPFGPGDTHNGVGQLPRDGDVVLAGVIHGQIGSGQEGYRWTRKTGVELLGDLPGGDFFSNLGLCSRDGRVGAGRASPSSGDPHMARWTKASGWQDLDLTGAGGSAASISGDGWVVVGYQFVAQMGAFAVIWNPIDGTRLLQDVLEKEYGVNLSGWKRLSAAYAISDNGRYIAGIGHNPQGKLEGWLVEMPPFCYADCDRSTGKGVLDLFDFLCFINKFNARDPYGNCDNDGAFDLFDFLCFINHFTAGCQP